MKNQDISKTIVVYGNNLKFTGEKDIVIKSRIVKGKNSDTGVDNNNNFHSGYGSIGDHKIPRWLSMGRHRSIMGLVAIYCAMVFWCWET